MPNLSMFYGIVIYMYKNDHNPPHIHAKYQGCDATYTLDGEPLEGELPPKQNKLVTAWIAIHQDELEANWMILGEDGTPCSIDPLK